MDEKFEKRMNAILLDFVGKMSNMAEKIGEEIFVLDISQISGEDINMLMEHLQKGDFQVVDDYINYQDFPELYKERIEEILSDDQGFPSIFRFNAGIFAIDYIRAEEDSDLFMKDTLYRLTTTDDTGSVWVYPSGKGSVDDGQLSFAGYTDNIVAINESFPSLFDVEYNPEDVI